MLGPCERPPLFDALPPYLGGKRRLAPLILADLAAELPAAEWPGASFCDPMCGGGAVAPYVAHRAAGHPGPHVRAAGTTMKDGLAIPALLTLGAVAGIVGVRAVLTVAPLLLLALALGVDRLAGRLRAPVRTEAAEG